MRTREPDTTGSGMKAFEELPVVPIQASPILKTYSLLSVMYLEVVVVYLTNSLVVAAVREEEGLPVSAAAI